MTTISEAFVTLASVQKRLEDENATTAADITSMKQRIEATRLGFSERVTTLMRMFESELQQIEVDLDALLVGRHRSVSDAIGASQLPMEGQMS